MAAIFAPLFAATWAAVPSIDATIEPSQIEMGGSARLTILTSGSSTMSVPLPVVPGLEFRVVGQSRQIQMINGVTIESTSTIIRVTAQEPGIFSIPGVTPKSPQLILRVNAGHGGGSAPPTNGASPGGAPLVPGKTSAQGVRLTPDGSAFVRLEMPKHEIYVGESIPVEIQVGMRDGFVASINALPKLDSGDFTLNNLSHQPERAAKVLDGKPFTVLTWRSLLAAIKPGTFSLTFEIPLTVRMRTRPLRDSLLDDLLGDPFLQNIFGATVPKNVTVTSPQAAFSVLPLPAEGKPTDFAGAVGTFKMSADISTPANTAGDPLTLRMHVSGTGNFDRVQSSMLGGDAEWKAYSPKATFNPSDSTGLRGDKLFEQPLIASLPGTHVVPPLSFSFFNPQTRRYETAHSAPLSVVVSPSAAQSAALGTSGATQAPGPSAAAPAGRSRSGLRPDHADTKTRVDSLIPPYFQTPFLGVTSALVLLYGAGRASLQRRKSRANDVQRGRERARYVLTPALLERMNAASARGDAAAFFNAACTALRQILSVRWRLAADQIGIADVDARHDFPDKEDIRRIFVFADEANYSGGGLQSADYQRWIELVRRQSALGNQS
ncbi:MAG: hypothetical protein NVS9B2_01180 [Steroidobacteraceae bacterium]